MGAFSAAALLSVLGQVGSTGAGPAVLTAGGNGGGARAVIAMPGSGAGGGPIAMPAPNFSQQQQPHLTQQQHQQPQFFAPPPPRQLPQQPQPPFYYTDANSPVAAFGQQPPLQPLQHAPTSLLLQPSPISLSPPVQTPAVRISQPPGGTQRTARVPERTGPCAFVVSMHMCAHSPQRTFFLVPPFDSHTRTQAGRS